MRFLKMPDSEEQKKREILKDLFVSEQDTLDELKELVNLSKPLFKIEKETGKLVFSETTNANSRNKDKLVLLLIGRYLAKVMGVVTDDGMQIAAMSEQLGIPKTTLSGPLGELVSEDIIRKNDQSFYSIVHHKIKPALMSLTKGGKKE